jgi:hypothetical protein
MVSAARIATIQAEISKLEKARKDCMDGGIQKQIDVWIEEQRTRLDPDAKSRPPFLK